MSVHYDALMREAPAHIVVTIDVEQPIELLDFVSMFSSMANQFERFIRVTYPELESDAKIFIREVRSGSIQADLIPLALIMIGHMDVVLIVDQFVTRYGNLLSSYFQKGGRAPGVTKSDLRDFMQSVTVIANDPNGEEKIEVVSYEASEKSESSQKVVRASIQFNTKQARIATEEIEAHRRELEHREEADYSKVLMIFYQTNLKDAPKSGEKALIEEISDRPLPIIYVSDLARQRAKSEIMHGDRNVHRLGFVVDVNVVTLRGRPVAYRLIQVHDVIELPPDDEEEQQTRLA